MKFLVIDNGQAKYTVDPTIPASTKIDQISKDDLFKLLEFCLTEEDFEMDPYDDNKLQNKAHQIIYKNLYQKLDDVMKQRVRFSDEKTALYRTAITKYSTMLSELGEN